MTIQAIETSYKGYRFRSRLEARWAVFFDALKYEWQYEPQGFQADHYEGYLVKYLPDFFLPDRQTWIEVKGSDELLQADANRLEGILDWRSPLPGIQDSFSVQGQRALTAPGLMILGEIPDPTRRGLHLHRIIQHYKGLQYGWAFFGPSGAVILNHDDLIIDLFDCDPQLPDWTTKPLFIPTKGMWTEVLDAYRAARSARFEHGESGGAKR